MKNPGATAPHPHHPGESRRPLRVLQMCAVDFTVRQFLLPLADALSDSGFKVTVSCSRGPYFEDIRVMGYDIRENPVTRSMNAFSHVGAIWRTYRYLRRERFDVVHVHTPIAALVGRIAARLAGVPVKIYTAHGFYFHEGMTPAKRAFHIMLERVGARFGNFIMTVSGEDEKTALELGIATPGTVETVYNGIDPDRFDPVAFSDEKRAKIREDYGIAPDATVIGLVGRLVREKGVFEFIDAGAEILRRYPETRFMIVGDVLPSDYDADRSGFLQRLDEHGIRDRFVFTGMVADTRPTLAAMDVFCLPSYREGMPVSLLEAMAMELPCIATNIRGCREEIEDGKSGWLVPPRDPGALADRIAWYIENRSKAEAMGEAARLRVLDRFDIRKVLAHQVAIYDRLTANLQARAG